MKRAEYGTPTYFENEETLDLNKDMQATKSKTYPRAVWRGLAGAVR